MIGINKIWKNEVEADFKLQIGRIIDNSFGKHLE